MEYKEFVDERGDKHIILDLGDGAYKSFPADESNPEYISFLASQKEEK